MWTPSKKVTPRFFSERRVKLRILFVAFFCFMFYLVVIGRTFSLHLTDNIKLSRLAQSQYQKKITLAPKRGNIYDVNGEELAIDVKVDSVYTNPKSLNVTPELINQLASIFGIPSDKIEKILGKEKKFVWLKRRISPEESEKITALHQEGLGLVKEYKRFYPNKKLAATILGAVGLDSVALGGLELFYDRYLKSSSEPVVVNQDARGQSYIPNTFYDLENTHNVTLTLDKTIQFITEKELAQAVEKTQAKSGIAVVMNSRTGEILAMASYPDFDPNQYTDFDPSRWQNRVVTESFEPGSIFKAVTASAALESGKVDLNQKFNCEGGSYKIDRFTISDHGGGYGMMTLPEIMRVSSNIGSLKVAQYIGKDAFSKAVLDFGFGSKTGIDLPGEASGIMSPPKNWGTLQMSTIAFGQGISVTPVQIVTAYSAIANGGYLMKPFVVKKIVDSKGSLVKENNPQIVRKVLSETNARKVVEMLKLVVGPGGTGTAAQVEEYGTAGKTGTAQKVQEGKAGYADGKFVGSFVGIAPADDPRITVLVSINEPKGNHFGGVVAAPVFREIVRQVLPYLRIPPIGNKGPIILTKDDKKTESKPDAKKDDKNKNSLALKDKKNNPQDKNSKDKNKGKDKSEEKNKVEIPVELTGVEPGSYKVPNWTRKPLREIMKTWDRQDVKLVVEGSGICSEQKPAPGEIIKSGSEVKLYFKPPSST